MEIKIAINCLLFLLFCFSCQPDRKTQISRQVEEWQSKTIEFPGGAVFTRLGRDTVELPQSEKPYKVLVYVDSIGCTSCKLQLPKWKELMEEVDSLAPGAVEFLFYLHPKELKEVRYILKRDGFDHPVCLDLDDRLNRQNRFPGEITFQTFLLDRTNKVAVLGNPVHNHRVKELYLKQVQGSAYREKSSAVTQASLSHSFADLGTLKVGESRKATFWLRNEGSSPLVVLDVRTSCGCTTSGYDKKPAAPGDSLMVELVYTAEEKTRFSKTATVVCNTPRPLFFTISGVTN